MARTLAPLYEVTAFDASVDGIEHATSTGSNVRFKVASVYDEHLDDLVGTDFDAAYSLEVVEHLYYPRKLFAAARQCLKPRGLLVISTPYHGYLKNLALALTNHWDAHLTAHWDGGHIKFSRRPRWPLWASKEASSSNALSAWEESTICGNPWLLHSVWNN